MTQMSNDKIESTTRGNVEMRSLTATQKKAYIVNLLEREGMRKTDVAALLDISRPHVTRLSKKSHEGLLAPAIAKIARKSIKTLASGELVGKQEKITGSEIIAACNTILDRTDPKVIRNENKSLNVNVSIDLSDDDRDRYRKELGTIDTISTP